MASTILRVVEIAWSLQSPPRTRLLIASDHVSVVGAGAPPPEMFFGGFVLT
jgi:hypothetical protein